METIQYKGYTGSIETSLEDNCLHGRVQFIRDVITYEGKTPKELERDFHRMVDVYLDSCKRRGVEPGKPFSGSFNVRIGPDLHRAAAQASLVAGVSMNQWVADAIRARLNAGSANVSAVPGRRAYPVVNSMTAAAGWNQSSPFTAEELIRQEVPA